VCFDRPMASSSSPGSLQSQAGSASNRQDNFRVFREERGNRGLAEQDEFELAVPILDNLTTAGCLVRQHFDEPLLGRLEERALRSPRRAVPATTKSGGLR
jgi:hypothetical protein